MNNFFQSILAACILLSGFTLSAQAPPPNDECDNAVVLTPAVPGAACVPTSGNINFATQSIPPINCGRTSSVTRDLWYKFTATAINHVITVSTPSDIDPIIDVRSGSCPGINIACADNTGFGETEMITVTGLTVGDTYFVRVYGYSIYGGSFNICVTTPAGPLPANDECTNATGLVPGAPGAPCSGTTPGTTVNATQSIPTINCNGSSAMSALEVWYEFTASSSSHLVTVVGDASFNAVIDVRTGACFGLTFACADNTSSGAEVANLTGLTVGEAYRIRIYDSNSGTGTFTICITTPIQPANDQCANATVLAPGVQGQGCTSGPISGTNVNALQSLAPIACNGITGSGALDVWYQFTATKTVHDIMVVGTGSFDAVVDVRSGACDGSNIACANNTTSGAEMVSLNGLTIGATYHLRVYGWNSSTGSFTVCITTPYEPPPNDECADAIMLTPLSPGQLDCSFYGGFTEGTLSAATQSIPPISCNGTTSSNAFDVWYKFTATETNHTITIQPLVLNMNVVIDLRSGACPGTTIACADNTMSGTEILDMATGLTIGATYLIRIYASGGTTGAFRICLSTKLHNDECANAVVLTPAALGAACVPTSGNINFATQSIPPINCGRTSSVTRDLWYKFTATAINHVITVSTPGAIDPIIDVRSGSCPGINIACADNTGFGETEMVTVTGLTVGDTYFVRVYGYSIYGGSFNICVTTPQTPPPACVAAPIAPAVGAQFCPVAPVALSWPAANGATSYEVYLGTSATPPLLTTVTATTFTTATLPAGAYFWQVRPVNSTGAASGCAIWNFTMADAVAPTITCPASITQPNTAGLCSRVVTYSTPTANDNCTATPTVLLLSGLLSGSSFPVGITANVWRATDATGNSASCTVTVTITDTQAPNITCPASQTLTPPVGQCTAVVTYSTPTASDNCSIQSVSHVSGGVSGAMFPAGVTTVIWRATDVNTNSTTCFFTVTVNGNTVPSITCPANIVQPNTAGLCAAVVNYAQPTAPLVCGAAPTIELTSGLSSGASFPVGTTTVAYTATAGGGATATCSFTVTINDTQPPTVTCPANTTVLHTNAGASCEITIPNYIASLTATDNCSLVTEAQSIAAGPYSSGVSEGAIITLSYTATDGATPANTTTCTVNITVHDDDAPAVVCQNATVNLNAAGTGSISTSAVFQSGTDNCGTVSQVSVVPNAFTCANLGANTVVLTVNDGHGNNATCNATVTVVDLLPPTVVCKPFTAALNAAGQASVTPADVFQSGTDNCGTVNQVSVVPNAFTCANLGANPVTLTVNDGHGNNATCNATCTVVDLLPPSVVCKPFTAALNAAGQATITPANVFQSGADNCGTVSQVSVVPSTFTCASPSTNTVVLTVNDGHGNNATCNATVTVVDLLPPTVVCKSFTAALNAAGQATITPANVFQSGTDNCGTVNQVSVVPSTFTCASPSTNTVVLSVNDGHGNNATCNATVTVVDLLPPTVVCKSYTATLNAAGQATITPANVFQSGTDNCGTVNPASVSPNSFTCGNIGANTVQLTVNDGHGNNATCMATVKVDDVTPPALLCKPSVILNLDASGNATLTVAQVNNGSSDNCGISTLSLSKTAFSCINIGANTVQLTGADASGNTGSCTSVVTVQDVTQPVAKCKNIIANLGVNGTVTVAPASVNNGSTDNCSFNLTLLPATFNCGNIGVNTATLKATDAGGNSSTCTATVTVKDMTAPTASCKNPTIYLDDNGHATLTVAAMNNGSSDACGILSLSINNTAFDCSNISGVNYVTLTVKDLYNNTASCIGAVTVKDNQAPTAVCEDVTVQLNALGKAVVYGANLAPYSYDNCAVWSYTPVAKVYTTANLGVNNLNITVKDWSGNGAACVSQVTVLPYGSNQMMSGSGTNDARAASEPAAERSGSGLTTEGLILFPNPTTGTATARFELPADQSCTLRVLNLSGRLIMDRRLEGQEGENSILLDVQHWSAGMYIVEIRSDGLQLRKQLVVQQD